MGMWVGADGAMREARIKGGPLFDEFHGITSRTDQRNLAASKADLARAYASAVWAYRCIKLRADAVAGIPLVLRDRRGAQIENHPVLDLLRDVNPTTMNLSDLLRATEAAYNIWGMAYWLKIRATGRGGNAGGRKRGSSRRVRWLQWLNPQTVEMQVDSQRGVIGYKQTIGSTSTVFAPEDVIVFRNFNPLDDLGGLSPLSVALTEINAELNAGRYVTAFFSNDARPAGLLTTDQPMHEADLQRSLTWWQQLFQGTQNKWKTGIMGGGMRWQQIGYPPRDLALAELRGEDRRAICAAFGVPPGLAGAWDATTYATGMQQKASFYEDTVLPQIGYLAEVLNWSLLSDYPDLTAEGVTLGWDTDGIAALRESEGDKATRLIALLNAGVVGVAEVRAEMGMPALYPETPEGQPDSPSAAGVKGGAGTPQRVRHDVSLQDAAKASDDLKRWRRRALKRIRDGKHPVGRRAFKSVAIHADQYRRIDDALRQAQTAAEVSAAFEVANRVSPIANRQDSGGDAVTNTPNEASAEQAKGDQATPEGSEGSE